jgi:hypothetical protein
MQFSRGVLTLAAALHCYPELSWIRLYFAKRFALSPRHFGSQPSVSNVTRDDESSPLE